MPADSARIEEIRARHEKATPGEWTDSEFVRDAKIHRRKVHPIQRTPLGSLAPEDADFIVRAHNTDIPYLLTLVTEQAARIAELEKENGWLRRLIQWCRMRLRREGYAETLDRYLAEGVTEPDMTPIVLSSLTKKDTSDD